MPSSFISSISFRLDPTANFYLDRSSDVAYFKWREDRLRESSSAGSVAGECAGGLSLSNDHCRAFVVRLGRMEGMGMDFSSGNCMGRGNVV